MSEEEKEQNTLKGKGKERSGGTRKSSRIADANKDGKRKSYADGVEEEEEEELKGNRKKTKS